VRLRRHEETLDSATWSLSPCHPAAVAGTTRYPATVREPDGRVLKRGFNSKKIGSVVRKGPWKGLRIYTLTLEERATCPRSCALWLDCYGNKMHWAHRYRHGPDLEEQLEYEVSELCGRYGGVVVRLHVLGDFYAPEYVVHWGLLLDMNPGLRVFGYTAWEPGSPIGREVVKLNTLHEGRCVLRFSGVQGAYGATVVDTVQEAGGVVCPAQTGGTECCATCGFCWNSTDEVTFLRH